jgi:hypothetical protein
VRNGRRRGTGRPDPAGNDPPEQVVVRLQTMRRVTAADELLLPTITCGPTDRARSFEPFAGAWFN